MKQVPSTEISQTTNEQNRTLESDARNLDIVMPVDEIRTKSSSPENSHGSLNFTPFCENESHSKQAFYSLDFSKHISVVTENVEVGAEHDASNKTPQSNALSPVLELLSSSEKVSDSAGIVAAKVEKKRVSFTDTAQVQEFDSAVELATGKNLDNTQSNSANVINTVSMLDERLNLLGNKMIEHISSEESMLIKNSLSIFNDSSEDSVMSNPEKSVSKITTDTSEEGNLENQIGKGMKYSDADSDMRFKATISGTLAAKKQGDNARTLKTSVTKKQSGHSSLKKELPVSTKSAPDTEDCLSLSFIDSMLDSALTKNTEGTVKKSTFKSNVDKVLTEIPLHKKKEHTACKPEASKPAKEKHIHKNRDNTVRKREKVKLKNGILKPHSVWHLISLDITQLKYKLNIPSHIKSMLFEAPSEENSEDLLRNDPRIQSYLGLYIVKAPVNLKGKKSPLISPSTDSNWMLNNVDTDNSHWDLNLRKFFQETSNNDTVTINNKSPVTDIASETSSSKVSPLYVVNNYAALFGNGSTEMAANVKRNETVVNCSNSISSEGSVDPIAASVSADQASVAASSFHTTADAVELYPNEKEDLEHPDWEQIRSLSSELEQFNFIRNMWGNDTGRDLIENLTTQNYRRNRLEQDGVLARSYGGKRKPEDNAFIMSLLPVDIAPKTFASTFMQDEELVRNNDAFKESVQMWRNKSLSDLDTLQHAYEEKCEYLKTKLMHAGPRKPCDEICQLKKDLETKLEEGIDTVIQKYKTRYTQMQRTFVQESNVVTDIRDEILRYDRYCGNNSNTRLSHEQHEDFLHIKDMVQSFSEIYKTKD